MSLKDRANSIARELKHYRPVTAEPVDFGDRMIFVFDIIPHETLPWTKGVEIESVTASAETVSMLMEDWKKKIRSDLMMNRPSPPVVRAIEVHGLAAVKAAVKPWPTH